MLKNKIKHIPLHKTFEQYQLIHSTYSTVLDNNLSDIFKMIKV